MLTGVRFPYVRGLSLDPAVRSQIHLSPVAVLRTVQCMSLMFPSVRREFLDGVLLHFSFHSRIHNSFSFLAAFWSSPFGFLFYYFWVMTLLDKEVLDDVGTHYLRLSS